MQSSIKNTTGEYTVLGNIESLRSGALTPEKLGSAIKVWQDKQGIIWSLDHRRLAAFKEGGTTSISVQWATRSEVVKDSWKMTTKSDGMTIKLKIGPGESRVLGQ
jgi:hypothetical protein